MLDSVTKAVKHPRLEWVRTHRRTLAKLGWLGLILMLLGSFKIPLSEVQESVYIDGGYYTSIAVFVRDGLGLKTNISLYHQAYSYFPHPTSVSPIWPLLYGYAARIWPLFDVAIWLPTFLYFTALFCAWGWGSSMMPATLFRSLPHFDAGHILVLMLGLHREFFQFTSAPYTEGLAYTVLFAVLWRFHVVVGDKRALRGVEVGLLLALAMLARAQFAIVAIAMFMAVGIALAFSPDRKQWLKFATGMTLTYVAVIGAFYLWLRTFVGNTPADALLRFDQGWETDALSTFHPMVNTEGLVETLKDRAEGVEVAFDLDDKHAYRRSFWFMQYAVPASVPFLIATALQWATRERLREAWAFLKTDAAVRWAFVLLLALGGFVSIHLIHKDYFSEWHFHRRQGLTAILLFFLCLVYLLKRRWVGPAVGVLILGASLHLGFTNLHDQVEAVTDRNSTPAAKRYKSLISWLDGERKTRDSLTVAMAAHEPQKMAFETPEVGYHWIYRHTKYSDIETLVDDLGVDYIVLTRSGRRWGFARDKRFKERFHRVTSRSGMTIYAPK